jgi:hypothetical protein
MLFKMLVGLHLKRLKRLPRAIYLSIFIIVYPQMCNCCSAENDDFWWENVVCATYFGADLAVHKASVQGKHGFSVRSL